MKVTTADDQIAGHDGTRRSVVRIDGGEIDSDEPGDAHLDVEGWLVSHEIRVDAPDIVTLPRGGVSVADGPDRLPPEASRSVEGGATLVCESPVACLVRVNGGASVTVDSRGRATVRPEGDVVVGWTHRPDPAVTEISLPSRDAVGVATALRAATAVALPSTQTPDRTWPNSRSAAPSITTTPHRGTHPSEVERVDTGVELTVPDDLAAVAATATLAGYLGAEVSVGEEATLHAAGESRRLGSEPETVDSRSSSFLRRVFYLDCHVRSAGPHGTRLAGHAAALAAVDGDAETLYELSLAERAARYLAADDQVDDELPRWPETLHVEPSVERLTGVTPQLCRLADVRLPRCERLELPDMIDYEPREAAVRGAADTDPKARVVPDSAGEAAITGWAAAGRPTAAFAATEPVTRQPREDDGPLRVTVVQCGGESAAETAARWRETIAEQEIDLSVVSRPTVEQLRETLRADHDIVHVAAHDGGAGVECADGTLGLVDLPDSITPSVVVWNVCDSEALAEATVAAGAVAAVGTTGPVPRADARRDGADFARLLSLGWCAERAVRLLRRCRDPLGWVVVGDGGARVGQSSAPSPPLVVIDTDENIVMVDYRAANSAGKVVGELLAERACLSKYITYPLESDTIERLAGQLNSPVVVSGELRWPKSL